MSDQAPKRPGSEALAFLHMVQVLGLPAMSASHNCNETLFLLSSSMVVQIAHLLIELGAQGGHAIELHLADELIGRGHIPDAIALLLAIHEPDEDAIIIKQRGDLSNTPQDQLEVVDALSILLKCH